MALALLANTRQAVKVGQGNFCPGQIWRGKKVFITSTTGLENRTEEAKKLAEIKKGFNYKIINDFESKKTNVDHNIEAVPKHETFYSYKQLEKDMPSVQATRCLSYKPFILCHWRLGQNKLHLHVNPWQTLLDF